MTATNTDTARAKIRISKLQVRFEVPGIESKKIYANGRMQVRVWVFVEAVDRETGSAVQLPFYPSLVTTRLIRYHDGKPLRGDVYANQPMPGWTSCTSPNEFVHEMPGAVLPPSTGGSDSGSMMEFWVSSAEEGQLQIAAEITCDGQVYRSNKTANPDGSKLNSSVIVVAERSPAYSHEEFTWRSEEVRGAFNGYTLFRYHLGLYPGRRQVKLLSWDTAQYEGSGQFPLRFCYTGLILSHPAPRSFTGIMAPVGSQSIDVLGFQLPVKQGDGEIVAFMAIPPDYKHTGVDVRLDNYFFTVLDEYGNTHKLSLIIDIQATEFLLRRG